MISCFSILKKPLLSLKLASASNVGESYLNRKSRYRTVIRTSELMIIFFSRQFCVQVGVPGQGGEQHQYPANISRHIFRRNLTNSLSLLWPPVTLHLTSPRPVLVLGWGESLPRTRRTETSVPTSTLSWWIIRQIRLTNVLGSYTRGIFLLFSSFSFDFLSPKVSTWKPTGETGEEEEGLQQDGQWRVRTPESSPGSSPGRLITWWDNGGQSQSAQILPPTPIQYKGYALK